MHWREEELIEIIKKGERLNTSDIVSRSRMCKVTALKYLKSLQAAGHVIYERIGPTKLWQVNQHNMFKEGEEPPPTHFQNILRMLKEFEEATGKKGLVLMSAENCEITPPDLKVSFLEDGISKIELKTVEDRS